MAMTAQKIVPEMFMEERTARLETNVEHIQSDISEMKVDVREIRGEINGVRGEINGVRSEMKEMDGRLTSKIDGVNQQLTLRMDGIKDAIAALALANEKSFASLQVKRMVDRLWWGAISAALLGVIARAFKWI